MLGQSASARALCKASKPSFKPASSTPNQNSGRRKLRLPLGKENSTRSRTHSDYSTSKLRQSFMRFRVLHPKKRKECKSVVGFLQKQRPSKAASVSIRQPSPMQVKNWKTCASKGKLRMLD